MVLYDIVEVTLMQVPTSDPQIRYNVFVFLSKIVARLMCSIANSGSIEKCSGMTRLISIHLIQTKPAKSLIDKMSSKFPQHSLKLPLFDYS